MSSGYQSRDEVKQGTAQSVGASATHQVVSKDNIRITGEDSRNLIVKVEFSAVEETTGITVSLQDSYDKGSTWRTHTTATLDGATIDWGLGEVSTINFADLVGTTDGDYVVIDDALGASWAVALDTTGAAAQTPTGAKWTAIAAANKVYVDVSADANDEDIAATVKTALEALTGFSDVITIVDNADGTLTLTQVYGGNVDEPDPEAFDDGGAGSILGGTTTAGDTGDLNLTNNTITEAAHGWVTGDRVVVSEGSAQLPVGVSAGVYYVIKVDDNTIKLATSYTNALAGTAVDLTVAGAGNSAIMDGVVSIEHDVTESSVGILFPLARVTVSSGASDSATVSAVWVTSFL